jgi:hypothetical protein
MKRTKALGLAVLGTHIGCHVFKVPNTIGQLGKAANITDNTAGEFSRGFLPVALTSRIRGFILGTSLPDGMQFVIDLIGLLGQTQGPVCTPALRCSAHSLG